MGKRPPLACHSLSRLTILEVNSPVQPGLAQQSVQAWKSQEVNWEKARSRTEAHPQKWPSNLLRCPGECGFLLAGDLNFHLLCTPHIEKELRSGQRQDSLMDKATEAKLDKTGTTTSPKQV